MPRVSALLLAVLLLPLAALSQSDYPVSGYVTELSSTASFDLEGVHVLLTPSTRFLSRTAPGSSATRPDTFFVGETLDAKGVYDHKSHTLTASEITLVPITAAKVSGTAIIDLIPPASPNLPSNDLIVRADGYLLHIGPKTKLSLTAPLKSLSDIATNQWIEYSGVQQLDGTVVLDSASIRPNRNDRTDDKINKRTDYDPAAVSDTAHQSGISKAFIGIDPKRIPPYRDAAMQARVERIGLSLIPAYQRALPDSDPTKIHFRFQVIENSKWHDALTLPSGVIVIPHQVVQRMQNDSQLATVLADNIAEAIEKDGRRTVTTSRRVLASSIVGDVAGAFIPGAGIATSLAGDGVAEHLQTLQLQQSGRVSLCFLHDAGYDIDQAPLAWWLLAPKHPKPMTQVAVPPRATTLLMALGATWHISTAEKISTEENAKSSPATDTQQKSE